MKRQTRSGLEDVTPIETCRPTHVQVRTESMPNVDELCDSARQHAPDFGGLGDYEDFETGYEGATCDGGGLEVVKGSSQ